MQTAKPGDRVRVQFARIGKSTAPDAKRSPPKVLEFVAGGSEVMPGLSQGVVGMAQGEQKRFKLQPDEAYGPVKPGLIKSIPRHQFPKRLTLRVGKRLSALSSSSGRRRRVRIVEINSKSVLVDGNHSLAGKVIELDVTLICVVSTAAGSQEP